MKCPNCNKQMDVVYMHYTNEHGSWFRYEICDGPPDQHLISFTHEGVFSDHEFCSCKACDEPVS